MQDETADIYKDAQLYDLLHAPGTAGEVDSLERIERLFADLDLPRLWLEPACGSARYLRRAAKRSIRSIGFDLEQGMLDYAADRIRTLDPRFRPRLFRADMADFVDAMPAGTAGCVSVAFNLINTIRHLGSDHDLHAHLEQTARALAPGGVYVVGLSTSMPEFEQPTEDIWTATRGTRTITQTVQYIPPTGSSRLEQVISHITSQTPTKSEDQTSTYALRTYSLEQWTRHISQSPLELIAAVDEDGEHLAPRELGYAIYILKKPRS